MSSTGQEHSKFWCLGFTQLQFLEKLSVMIHFVFSFSKAWFLGIIHRNFQKILSKIEALKILKSLFQPNYW